MRKILSPVLAVLASTLPMTAQGDQADYSDFEKMVVISEMFVGLHDACGHELTQRDERNYQRWRRDNHLDAIEKHVADRRRDNPAFDKRYQQITARIGVNVRKLAKSKCPTLSDLLGNRKYRPAIAYKREVRLILEASKRGRGPETPTALITDAELNKNLDRIDRVVMDERMVNGAGGFLYLEPNPAMLLDDGWAVTNMRALVYPGGFEKHRQDHPKQWKKWRSNWGEIELLKGETWKGLASDAEYAPLPEGTRLNGTFERLSGGGNTAIGGGEVIAAINGYQFFGNGYFLKGKHISTISDDAFGTTTTTQGTTPDERGRYEIRGYALLLTYDNRSKERRGLVFDANHPDIMWIDGFSYLAPD